MTRLLQTTMILVLVGYLWTIAPQAYSAGKPPWNAKYERQVGEEAAKEILQNYTPVDDADTLAKLQNMVDVLAANTERPDVKYTVYYVREKKPGPEPEVNAFSLPGGIVFVLEGLVKSVQSDHELAGVLAHEIVHNVHYDGLFQAQRAKKIFQGELAAVLASIIIGGTDSELWPAVMQAGLYYRAGVLGGYSVEMERKADEGAVEAMINSPWDPVGLLTFMERLAAEERRQGAPDMGVFKTHPLSGDRVKYLISQLERHGIMINRRKTANWEKPEIKDGAVSEKPAKLLTWRTEQVYAFDASQPERADQALAKLTEALAEGAPAAAFSASKLGDGFIVKARGEPVFEITQGDAAFTGKSAEELAKESLKAIRQAIARESFDRLY
jgi:predicted Zn-dependent protease